MPTDPAPMLVPVEVAHELLALINDLKKHNESRYGPWTKAMTRRVEEASQMVVEAWTEASRTPVRLDSMRLHHIAMNHGRKMHDDTCEECFQMWPCPTYKMATGEADVLSGEWRDEDDYEEDDD